MSISENIAKYRKQRGYTQEKLGELVGVSNQAVSKWELGISMPDVMMLPKIAEVLGISLEQLYGIEKDTDIKNTRVTADDFPIEANKKLIEYFREQSGQDFNRLDDPWALVCVSELSGAAYISNNISFIDMDYKSPSSERVFNMGEVAFAMKKLSDSKIRTVLAYMYRESFAENEPYCKSFLISKISSECGLSEDEVLEVMEKMMTLQLLETLKNDENRIEYFFIKSRAFFALATFKLVELLIQQTHSYAVLRDKSLITDHTFEKTW